MLSELKPCPFCGYKDEDIVIFNEFREDPYKADCPSMDCLAGGYYKEKKDAVNSWNTRHTLWISVEDTLPNNGENILFYDGRSVKIGHIELSDLSIIGDYYNASETKWIERHAYPVEGVTHWMPLPELPVTWSSDLLSVSNGGPGGPINE